MRVIYNLDCRLHDPPHEILSGQLVDYLESPSRLDYILKALTTDPIFELSDAIEESIDLNKYILQVHDKDYLSYLETAYERWVEDGGDKSAVLPETFAHHALLASKPTNPENLSPCAKAGLYCFDLSCPIMSRTYEATLASLRVVLTAASQLDLEKSNGIFALCRPPGHHAGLSTCGGYCFLNNISIAARFLQSRITSSEKRARMAILDIDYHHGNGTQQIFYDDPSVLYVSLHAENDYPYFTGTALETGTGDGEKTTVNFPLPRRTTGDDEYCQTLERAVAIIREYDPVCVLVSLGVDTYMDDPICEFKITTPGYKRIGEIIGSIGKPALFVMEGGYHLETLGENVANVLRGFN
ncbi:Arginase/deacetylase, partial [Rickenella mellea]